MLLLKWRQVLPMQLELQLAQVNLYIKKDFKLSSIWSLYDKQLLISNELIKTSLILKFSLQNSLQNLESLFYWYGAKGCW